MREILSRGKLSHNNKWLIGDLVVNQEGTLYIIPSRIIEQDGHHLEIFDDYAYLVNNNTIGQFTGLTDKNGTKVFEGDILKTPQGNVCRVVFKTKTHKHLKELMQCTGWCVETSNGYLDFLDETILKGEVIGNIHDNKDLIE